MAALAGTMSYLTTVYLTAASSGDATTIAAMLNGVTIPGVDVAGTATSAVSSITNTIVITTWPVSQVRVADASAVTAVMSVIAGNSALTSPVTNIYARTEGKIV